MIPNLRRIARDKRGVAMLEFAFSLPLVVPLGLYAIEMSNFALTQMKISQYALALADNASRVGVDSGLASQEIREADVNDVFEGLRLQGKALDVGKNGRVTLSSLEADASGKQSIHWQRCIGEKSGATWDSSYGAEGDGLASGDTFNGMGETGAKVVAPPSSGVMFVEINYQYRPLISNYFLGNTRVHFIASFIVRDRRDFAKGITNPNPAATQMTCSQHIA